MVSAERQKAYTAKVKLAIMALLCGECSEPGKEDVDTLRMIEESVWTADEDRERDLGWASDNALCVICTENGLPGTYDHYGIEFYFDVMNAVGKLVEPYNAAIIVVYDD